MIADPATDARELRACALAALSEAGVVFVPVGLLLYEARPFGAGIAALAIAFVVVYVAGAILAFRFRGSRALTTTVAIVATAAGVVVGGGELVRSLFAVAVGMLVGLRVVVLALRDWRAPNAIGWGIATLGVEALLLRADWRPLLVAFVPLFFGAALASRATTVAGELDDPRAGSWIRGALLGTGGLAAAMALAVVLGVRGGALDLVGRLVRPVAEVVGSAILWLIVQAARPLFWLADRLGIDPERVREFFERLRESVAGARGPADVRPPAPAPWARVLGLLVFVALAYAVYRLLRRYRDEPAVERETRPRPAGAPAPEPLGERIPRARPRFRRELPADAVRRWYAEVLLDLRGRHLAKEPALTPAEFVPIVAAEFPACADDFRALTRSYEHVRYGSIRLGRGALRDLEHRQRRLRSHLARSGHGTVTWDG